MALRSAERGDTAWFVSSFVRLSQPHSGVIVARAVRKTRDNNDAPPDVNSALHQTSTRRVGRRSLEGSRAQRSTARGATNVLTKSRNLVRPSRPLSGVLVAWHCSWNPGQVRRSSSRVLGGSPDVNATCSLGVVGIVARFNRERRYHSWGPQPPWCVPRGDSAAFSSAGSWCGARDKNDARPDAISAVQLRSMRRVARASLVGAWTVS